LHKINEALKYTHSVISVQLPTKAIPRIITVLMSTLWMIQISSAKYKYPTPFGKSQARTPPMRRRDETFFSSGLSTEAVRRITARRSHHLLVEAQLTSPLPSRYINIIHLRLVISARFERRRDVSITKFYWLFKGEAIRA
jgi:hypothetical protein